MTDPILIWSYLAQGPLLWLTATLVAYVIGDACSRAVGRQSWANPVLISVILLALLLWATGTDYTTYFEGAQFVHFMLGPATVALALPLYDNLPRVRRALAAAGRLDQAWLVERGTMQGQRIAPLSRTDLAECPYFSIILVPGQGRRPVAAAADLAAMEAGGAT